MVCGGEFYMVKETEVHVENHRPAVSHWQTLSHNAASAS